MGFCHVSHPSHWSQHHQQFLWHLHTALGSDPSFSGICVGTHQAPAKIYKPVSSPWCVESGEKGWLIVKDYAQVPSNLVNFLLLHSRCVMSSTVGVLQWSLLIALLDISAVQTDSAYHWLSRSRWLRIPSLWAPPLEWWFLVLGTPLTSLALVATLQLDTCVVHVQQVWHHCIGWCSRFLGNNQFLWIYLGMLRWDLL